MEKKIILLLPIIALLIFNATVFKERILYASESNGKVMVVLSGLPGIPQRVEMGMTKETFKEVRTDAKSMNELLKKDKGKPIPKRDIETFMESQVIEGKPIGGTTYIFQNDICITVSSGYKYEWATFLEKRNEFVRQYIQKLGPGFKKMYRKYRAYSEEGYSLPSFVWEVKNYNVVLSVSPDFLGSHPTYGDIIVNVMAKDNKANLEFEEVKFADEENLFNFLEQQ